MYYHPCSAFFIKYLGMVTDFFLPVRLKALPRRAQDHYVHYTEAWNDLSAVAQEVSNRLGCGTCIFWAHVPRTECQSQLSAAEKSPKRELLLVILLTKIWQTNPVWGRGFFTSVQYPVLWDPKEDCTGKGSTGVGRNTFMGVLNQQGFLWLFSYTVLFEHVPVQYARGEFGRWIL